jgi:hypothetical protein
MNLLSAEGEIELLFVFGSLGREHEFVEKNGDDDIEEHDGNDDVVAGKNHKKQIAIRGSDRLFAVGRVKSSS